MKKIYSFAVAVLTFGCAAYAGNVNGLENMQPRQLDQAAVQSMSVAANSSVKKAPQKVVTFNSIEEMYGVYNMAVQEPLNGRPEGFQKRTIEIKASATPGCVDVVGIAFDIPITAQVDLAERKLTFKKQKAYTHTLYGDINFTPMKEVLSPVTQKYTMVEADEFLLQFSEKGVTITTKDEEGNDVPQVSMEGPLWIGEAADGTLNEYAALPVFQGGALAGYFQLYYVPLINDFATVTAEELPLKNLFTPVFKYNASEWVDCGEANFTDGFLAPGLLTNPLEAYKVKVQKNTVNPNLILLVDPYGPNTPWAQVTNEDGSVADTNAEPGYIMLDFQDPSCVAVVPMVNTGLALNDEAFYVSNLGGQYMYIDGYTIGEVVDSYDYLGYEKPSYDKGGNVLKIYDNMYATVDNLYLYSQFVKYVGEEPVPIESETVIEFSQDVTDSSAVEGIEADSNVAPKYFNLQGMEVKNPAAGEVVIVKKGSKAFKAIVK